MKNEIAQNDSGDQNDQMKSNQQILDQLCVNTLRTLSIDAIQKANSGHPGLPLGAAPMAYVLWTRYLKHNPVNPQWYNRDRFVLSAGHGSMLLYCLLFLTGYALPLDQIKQFRQWDSMTPGHPEMELTPGVEITTGPLGQGFANGVGMAIAQSYLAARYNRAEFNIIDHFTYGLVSDGDLMEGVASEAASLAGHLKLGKLIYLYDNNHMTLSASTQLTFTENTQKRFEAYGWHTQVVDDGNNLAAIQYAIEMARQETNKPSLILVRTHIGYGSPHKHDTYEVHGSPLGVEEVKLTKQNLGWPIEPDFFIPKEVIDEFRKAIKEGQTSEQDWNSKLVAYETKYPALSKEFQQLIQQKLPQGWNENIPQFPADIKGMAIREASNKVMQSFSPNLPGFIGGSADLNPSTKTELINFGNFQSPSTDKGDLQGSVEGGWNYEGRNLYYGVREHAMAAISNGLATFSGIIPFAATFLIFSDYMRPAIRLAAIMKRQVIYVFTHDSIGLGEDGRTHQPVEQLASLRAIPNLVVIRPADANEVAVAWQVAIKTDNKPVALVLTRQNVATLDREIYSSAEGLSRGAYVLADSSTSMPDIILIATGSEVALIVAAQQELQKLKINVRTVSMPSWELFEMQSQEYRESILPPFIPIRLAVEAGVAQGWQRYVGEQGEIMSIEEFGASAPGQILMQHYGFTTENVYKQALKLLNREKSE